MPRVGSSGFEMFLEKEEEEKDGVVQAGGAGGSSACETFRCHQRSAPGGDLGAQRLVLLERELGLLAGAGGSTKGRGSCLFS